jgi:hypothetical protein
LRERRVVLLAAFALGAAALGASACSALLGIRDLPGLDGGADASGEAGAEGSTEGGATDGGGDGGDSATTWPCANQANTEQCINCCANMDGGDQAFFQGPLHQCACQPHVCTDECPTYCPSSSSDQADCDLCVFSTFRDPNAGCATAANQAAQNAGERAIYECMLHCPWPLDSECNQLSTAKACYDCCEGKNINARNALFGATQARDCACDAGGCAGSCSTYCSPSSGVDTAACTLCALDALTDGGACSSLQCTDPGCNALIACMRGCPP